MGQSAALNQIIDNLETFDYGCGSFIGPAGSGKTFTLKVLASEIKRLYGRDRIMFVVPTWKASRVLRDDLDRTARIETVCRFIGRTLRRSLDNDVFDPPTLESIKRKADDPRIQELRILVVDESSMVSQEDANYIQQIVEQASENSGRNTFLLFTGDPYQLPPVKPGKNSSDEADQSCEVDVEYSKDMCEQFVKSDFSLILTEIVRNDGPVLEKGVSIRSDFRGHHSFVSSDKVTEASEIVTFEEEDKWLESALESIEDKKTDARILCFTNQSCKKLTAIIRNMMYGSKSRDLWIPGERILIPKYTMLPSFANYESAGCVIHSATEATVLSCVVHENFPIRIGPVDYVTPKTKVERTFDEIMYYDMQELEVQTASGIYTVFTPLLSDEAQARKELSRIRSQISGLIRRNCVGHYPLMEYHMHEAKKFFPKIYSQYVMTVHNSQGSSFDKVFIYSDVERCKAEYRNSMLYVAVTRARKGAYPLV